ncbi:MAG: sigma 54-interacting transcriptional regulator [Eubacteriaceae bacterium]|nr:sigma 54-interacting transcriptional regulator [Eubacteriaceae bacterium]
MRKVTIVAIEKTYAISLKEQYDKYLGAYCQFSAMSLEELTDVGYLDSDFVLLFAFDIFQQVRDKISDSTEIIVISLALNKKQVAMLKDIPDGTEALLVNFNQRTCMNTIMRMYDAGIRNIKLHPYYGQGDYDRNIRIAITPNEEKLVPAGIKTVINVGESTVDMNSLYLLADKLGVTEQFRRKEAVEAMKEYYYLDTPVDKMFNNLNSERDKIHSILSVMQEGLLVTDSVGNVYVANSTAANLLKDRTRYLNGFNVGEILPEVKLDSTKERLVVSGRRKIVATSSPMRSGSEIIGYIVSLNDFEQVEEKQQGIRKTLREKSNHKARYHFEDIEGRSEAIRKTVEDAKRIAMSNSSVIIEGESGTGKELFAQSIHNGSYRRKNSFIAVNCAAIPENLLESEMFGYEGGAFTGAKKDGKAGYFEVAHQGTIFLDEIGEMPLSLQAKLLRVIEERTVTRIGGNNPIEIDVRIIAATNKDLFEMVQKGLFREDLYYRLNVLPLKLPSLNERGDDILYLFDRLVGHMNSNVVLSPEAEAKLMSHKWKGNVRELRNVAEYVVSRNSKYIDVNDLPWLRETEEDKIEDKSIELTYRETENVYREPTDDMIRQFIIKEGRDAELYFAILEQMDRNPGAKWGRKSIVQGLKDEGSLITEGEVKRGLTRLSDFGFIKTSKGRGGSTINEKGKALKNALKGIIVK